MTTTMSDIVVAVTSRISSDISNTHSITSSGNTIIGRSIAVVADAAVAIVVVTVVAAVVVVAAAGR